MAESFFFFTNAFEVKLASDTQREQGEARSDPLYREKEENTFGLQRWSPTASY